MPSTSLSLQELIQLVHKTEEIDESGDAAFGKFLQEEIDRDLENLLCELCPDLLVRYLVWANGAGWEQFLKTAKPGDVPSGPRITFTPVSTMTPEEIAEFEAKYPEEAERIRRDIDEAKG
jgi:hypothetical protein